MIKVEVVQGKLTSTLNYLSVIYQNSTLSLGRNIQKVYDSCHLHDNSVKKEDASMTSFDMLFAKYLLHVLTARNVASYRLFKTITSSVEPVTLRSGSCSISAWLVAWCTWTP